MRRAELLLTQVQRATENQRGSGSNDGISPEEYYQYFTDGLRIIQRAIVGANDKVFRTYTTWSADGTEDYSFPFDMLGRNMIATLEYKPGSDDAEYYRLSKVTQLERQTSVGSPSQYIVEGSRILVNAYPSTGTFRLTYNALLPAVDKRRGTVASRTVSSTAITALSITASGAFNADDYLLSDHLCIVDFNGNITMRGIPYTAVSAGGVVTIQGSSYTFPTGSTCAVGDYVCLGQYASTHFQIDDQAEGFLLAYCQKRIFNRDASGDAADMTSEMATMLQGIVELYGSDSDNDEIPITNNDYFDDLS